jgi:hypothetical protein
MRRPILITAAAITLLISAGQQANAAAERVPVTCEQFIASLNDKTYDAPPVAIVGEPLEYGKGFKDSKLAMFPDVYMGLSCLNGHLDSFEVMPDNREMMTAFHAGLMMGMALHAFGLDWKTALKTRDAMVRKLKLSKDDRAETVIDGATIRFYHGITGIGVFQIEYPDPVEESSQ